MLISQIRFRQRMHIPQKKLISQKTHYLTIKVVSVLPLTALAQGAKPNHPAPISHFSD